MQGFKPPPDAEPVSESVLTSSLGSFVLPRWAALLSSLGPAYHSDAASARKFGTQLRHALVDQAWNGRWLRRAWLGARIKWVGTSPEEADVNGSNVTMYSAQTGWALLANAFEGRKSDEQKQVASLLSQCRNEDWRLGFGYRCNNSVDPRPGSGMWPAVNQ